MQMIKMHLLHSKVNSLSFREHMYLHAGHEEKVVHPLLSKRVPGGANRLNEDHRIMRRQFDELVACFAEIKEKPTDFEKREEHVSGVLPCLEQVPIFLLRSYKLRRRIRYANTLETLHF